MSRWAAITGHMDVLMTVRPNTARSSGRTCTASGSSAAMLTVIRRGGRFIPRGQPEQIPMTL